MPFRNPFLDLSYFEYAVELVTKTTRSYISKYPSKLTHARELAASGLCASGAEIKTGMSFCDTIPYDVWDQYYDQYMTTINKHNFGLGDLFWWLPDLSVFTKGPRSLRELIEASYVVTGEATDNHIVVNIKNSKYPEFNLTGYLKSSSLPQEAIDVVPFFLDTDNPMNIYVALGHKKQSKRITSLFSDNQSSMDLLSTGIYGPVIFGEHLNQDEKQSVNEISKKFKSGNTPIKMEKKQLSPVTRTLLEEAGFDKINDDGSVFYVLYHSSEEGRQCRDDRYGMLYDGIHHVYGYSRASYAHTVCCVFFAEPPSSGNPLDQDECDKPVILPAKYVFNQFRDGGRLEPAFKSHMLQFRKCYDFVSVLAVRTRHTCSDNSM